MLTINTNTTSLTTQMNLSKSNSLVKTSIERMSTGFKINRASDDAANMSISKSMNCQISGTEVALENSQQAINLLQTADGALDNMQDNLQRIRELTVEALNGTYSSEEKQMIQQEVNQLLEETYKQKNNTYYNEIKIFGEDEEVPDPTKATPGMVEITRLTEEEAIAQGYTCIHSASEFEQIQDNTSGQYCLMGDIDFSQVSGWTNVVLYGELNGNGYAINNYTSTTGGLFNENYGKIKNLSMNNVNVTNTSDNTGALAGINWETIDNCSSSGTVKGTGSCTGGLTGQTYGSITNCSSSATVTGTTGSAGGIVGSGNGTISNCSSSATVNGLGWGAGGIIGGYMATETLNITNCTSSGIITGNENVGGIAGSMGIWTCREIISNCSSSATVTGNKNVGGIAGNIECGTIDKSYFTGTVTATGSYVGGLVGKSNPYDSWDPNIISNSYSTGDVSGASYVGGAVGYNTGSIENSYSTGEVTGTGSNIGGFVGTNGFIDEEYGWETSGYINNSYTTSELNFYGYQSEYSSTTDCHGTTTQDGVTAHDASWFDDSSNLTFLGSAYDYSINPPDIIGNERPVEEETGTVFQIGANSGEENTITVETAFSMGGYYADVTTVEAGQKTLVDTDNILNKISSERSKIGAMQNRLESVTSSLSTRENNLEASHSTIVDTDYAAESSKLVKNQILQNVASSLLAQANTTPEIALQLLT